MVQVRGHDEGRERAEQGKSEGRVEDLAKGGEGRKKTHIGWVSRGLGEWRGRAEHGDRQGEGQQIGQIRGQEGHGE